MNEFSQQDTFTAWAERAAKELKGKPLDTLNWVSGSGLQMKPYYSAEERKGRYPHRQTRNQNEWDVYESIEINSAKEANLRASQALTGGATALQFIWEIPVVEEIPQLLAGIELPYIQCGFRVPLDHAIPFAEALATFLKKQGYSSSSCQGYLAIHLKDMHSGADLATTLGAWFNIQKEVQSLLPDFRSMFIDGALFGTIGLAAHQELGLVLAWYQALLEQGNPPQNWQINLSFGTEFYSELCKFRIIAHLTQLIGEKYGWDKVPYLFGMASVTCIKDLDRYTNLLRLTTSAMSAVMGGANGILLKNFSSHKEDAPEFVARITRNCQLVLQHESRIAAVNDPASGAYFYEEMSFKLAEQAWESFLEIQEKGGLLSYLNSEAFAKITGGTGR